MPRASPTQVYCNRGTEKCSQHLLCLGRVCTNMGDFVGMKNYFKWITIYVLPETYRAMTGVVTECLKVHQMCLFPTGYGKKYMSLDEFEASQTQVTSNVRLIGCNFDKAFILNL